MKNLKILLVIEIRTQVFQIMQPVLNSLAICHSKIKKYYAQVSNAFVVIVQEGPFLPVSNDLDSIAVQIELHNLKVLSWNPMIN